MRYPARQDVEKDSSLKREATGPGTILDGMAGNPGRPGGEGGDLGQGGDSTSSQGLTLQGALQIPTLHWVLRVPPHAASFELRNLERVLRPPSQALRFLHPRLLPACPTCSSSALPPAGTAPSWPGLGESAPGGFPFQPIRSLLLGGRFPDLEAL